jgi:monofunctional biosynthetic peptidoglycan transglycosylase
MLNRFFTKKFWLRVLKILIGAFAVLLLWVILLKWIPIYFTPTMFFRSMEAYFAGKDSKIYYEWVNYSQVSDFMKVAVVASEDQRFPTHSGIDFAAVQVALDESKKTGKTRGASTISQQVAKNVFLWQGGGWFRKGLEVPLTYLIELIWGKQRILEVYLNIAETGPQTFGVQAAAKRFYKKPAKNLNAYEAATIAAVLPNPQNWLIQQPNGIVIYRRNHTLYQMQLLGGYQYLQNLRKF